MRHGNHSMTRNALTVALSLLLAGALTATSGLAKGKPGGGGGGRGGGDEVPPAAVADLQVDAFTHDTVHLRWTPTADDGDDAASGSAAAYDLRFIEGVLDDATWAEAYGARREPAPSAPGTEELFSPAGFLPNRTYQIGLKVLDEAGNASPISNLASVTTADSDWEVHVVASYTDQGAGLAHDAAGNPGVAYGKDGAVIYAFPGSGGWTHEVVDGSADAYGLSIAFDPTTGQPTLAYGRSRLLFARRHGPRDWTSEVVDSKKWNDVYTTSLAFDLAGRPTIAYTGKERRSSVLKYAQWSGASWDVETIGGHGRSLQHAIAPDGRTWIAHQGLGSWELRCSYRDLGASEWTRDILESGTAGNGTGVSLALNPITGHPGITHDASTTLFEWDGSGWAQDPDIGLDRDKRLAYAPDGTPVIGWTRYEPGTILKELWITQRTAFDPGTGGTWQPLEYVINGGEPGSLQYSPDGRRTCWSREQIGDDRWDVRYLIERQPVP